MELNDYWYCHRCGTHHQKGHGCPRVTGETEELIGFSEVEDVVKEPLHYRIPGLDVEALDVIRGVLTREEYIGYLRGNILKYQIRANKKGGEEDLQKSIVYSTELEIFLRDSA